MTLIQFRSGISLWSQARSTVGDLKLANHAPYLADEGNGAQESWEVVKDFSKVTTIPVVTKLQQCLLVPFWASPVASAPSDHVSLFRLLSGVVIKPLEYTEAFRWCNIFRTFLPWSLSGDISLLFSWHISL